MAIKDPGEVRERERQRGPRNVGRKPKGDRPMPFQPFPLEMARDFAARASAALHEIDPRALRNCTLCVHPDRQKIDFHILIGTSLANLQEVSGCEGAPAVFFYRHRDEHLMPLIRTTAVFSPAAIMSRPFPQDATAEEKKRWHWWRFWALCEGAFSVQSYAAAISAQKMLMVFDFGNIEEPDRLPGAKKAEKVQEQERLPGPSTDREDEILAAFANRTYRKQEGDDPQ